MRYTLTRLMDTLRGLPPESIIQAEGRAEYPTQTADTNSDTTNAYYPTRARSTWNITTSGTLFLGGTTKLKY